MFDASQARKISQAVIELQSKEADREAQDALLTTLDEIKANAQKGKNTFIKSNSKIPQMSNDAWVKLDRLLTELGYKTNRTYDNLSGTPIMYISW